MTGQRIIVFLGSWRMTSALMMLLIVSYFSFTVRDKPYTEWINFFFHAPAGLIIWVAGIVNLIFVSLRIVYARLGDVPRTPADIKTMHVSVEIPAASAADFETISAWMQKQRFTGTIRDNSLHGRKGRYSFLPGTLMRTGLILLMTALLFSAYLRRSEEQIVHQNEKYSFLGSEVSVESIAANLPQDFLQTGEEETFTLDTVSALLTTSEQTETITSGFPVMIGGRYYRIRDMGFSQELVIVTPGERIEKRLNLKILPPGKSDSVSLPSSGNPVLTFTLHPEKTVRKGLLTGKEYSLKNPHYDLAIQSGKEQETTERFTLRQGDTVKSGRQTVSLGNDSIFITIQAVDDPALFWIYTGILLTLAGSLLMLSRFFWYNKQLSAVFDGTTLHVGYGEEFFRKWAIHKFHNWIGRDFHNRKIYHEISPVQQHSNTKTYY